MDKEDGSDYVPNFTLPGDRKRYTSFLDWHWSLRAVFWLAMFFAVIFCIRLFF